ncbi:PucR family transcriptional regulator [Streptomyces sp. NPDC058464]|uniref:PucR family transcriptional regulator n=1 Tax=Streptomyces sp. NPDC058464 TaxID=3346511 RepID=UPI003667E681
MIAQGIRLLGPGPVAWAVEWAARARDAVVAREGPRAELPVSAVHQVCEGMLLACLARLSGHDWAPVTADSLRLVAVTAAEQDVPFSQVVQSMREIQRLWLEQLIAGTRDAVSAEAPAVTPLALSEVVDETAIAMVGTYMAERERKAEGRGALQRATVQALLECRPVDPDRAGADLGLRLDHHHIGLVLWRPGGAPASRLVRVAAQFADRLTDCTLLTVRDDDETLWAWLSRTHPPTAAESTALGGVRPGLAGTRVALGSTAAGAEGFRLSHLQARDTARVVQESDPAREVTSWQMVSLPGLLSSDLERARWFVQDTLGPLAADDPSAGEQRATLLSYLASGQSLLRTAQDQHVHRNTVVYRLRRIEEQLPYPLDERRIEVHCALLLAARFGAAVLDRETG